MSLETPSRIEPARLEEPTGAIADAVAELAASAATLGKALHPRTAGNLADLVRIMNTYYSNLSRVVTLGRATSSAHSLESWKKTKGDVTSNSRPQRM